jgi:hypothetical protein
MREPGDPRLRILRDARAIQAMITGNEDDVRLTEAQRHQGVRAILKCDPLLVAAKIVDRCLDPRSKWKVDPEVLHKMTLALHDRLYPMPDYRTRKMGAEDTQFELDFAWSVGEDGGRVAAMASGSIEEVQRVTNGNGADGA